MPRLAIVLSVRAMACNSLSLLPASSPTSSLPSISNSDSCTPFTISRPRNTLQQCRPDSFSSTFVKFRASFTRQPVQEDDDEDSTSAAKFEENSSIADFMRFKRSGGGSELETAVVSYRKKFPWSLHWFFLQRLRRFGRLLGALIYYIWMERSKRRVGERRLLPRTLAELIWSTISNT